MTVEIVRQMLGWAALLNLGLLFLWFGVFMVAHDWIYGVHSKWFTISADRYDSIHYMMMGFYELAIFVFLLGPYLALRIIGAT
jgi:hypothetical protein